MYTANLKFIIVDKNKNEEVLLSKTKPIEDCVYNFETVDSVKALEEIDFNVITDCAVINFTGSKIPHIENCIRQQ